MISPPSFTTNLLDDIERTSFVHDRDEVLAWVRRVAAMPSTHALRSIYRVLWKCNQKHLPWKNRLLLGEELEAPLAPLLAELDHSYHHRPLPLSRRSRKSAELAIHLHAFLTVAYKLVLEEFAVLSWMQRRAHKPAMLRAAVRSLRHCERVIIAYRMIGRAFPPDLWREAHWVYLHAHHLSLLGEHVHLAGEEPRDITHAYKRVLLLGLLRIQGLAPDQFRLLYRDLDDWVKLTRLMPAGRHASRDGAMFVVRADEDDPPQPLRRPDGADPGGLNSTRCLLLDGSAIGGHVRELLAGGPEGCPLSPESLERILDAWHERGNRRHERRRSMDAVEAIVGFEAIHRHLFMSHFAGIEGVAPGGEPRERPTPPRGDQDVWALAETGIYFQDSLEPTAEPRGESRMLRCRVMDVSPGGYRLAVPQAQTDPVLPGDLIATRASDEHDWMLGCIRWVSTDKRGFLIMGVEVLFLAALPLVLRPTARRRAGAPGPGLLACFGRDAPVLVMPYGQGRSSAVTLEFFGKRQSVTLTERVLSTGVVDACRFRGGRVREETRVAANDIEVLLQYLFADGTLDDAAPDDGWDARFAGVFAPE